MPPSDPVEVLSLLARGGVPFVIIGGHAVNFHGYVRTTEDADIVFQRTNASEAALLDVLQSIHACGSATKKIQQQAWNDSCL